MNDATAPSPDRWYRRAFGADYLAVYGHRDEAEARRAVAFVARALAIEPEVLLMDEPTSALDPKATAKIEDLIDELRGNFTIVIVTHNMQQAARVSDFTAFFYEGLLIEYGNTDRIFTKPRKAQTEDYITGRFG